MTGIRHGLSVPHFRANVFSLGTQSPICPCIHSRWAREASGRLPIRWERHSAEYHGQAYTVHCRTTAQEHGVGLSCSCVSVSLSWMEGLGTLQSRCLVRCMTSACSYSFQRDPIFHPDAQSCQSWSGAEIFHHCA